MSNVRITAVDEYEDGVYVWYTKDNRRVEDADGNPLMLPARKHDLRALAAMQRAANYYGVGDGRPHFIPGAREVTAGEYDEQQARLRAGLIPDPLDYKAAEDELRIAREREQRGE